MIDARNKPSRIAVAHDWLCGLRGGEHVLERICALVESRYSAAALFVMFDDRRPLSPTVDAWRSRGLIHRSRLGSMPGASGPLRRWLFPRYPAAVADLSRQLAALHRERPVDLLISSSSAAVKGIQAPVNVPHICYCHSPARYVWSRRHEYGGAGVKGGLRAAGLRLFADRFKRWDRQTASNVHRFIANSGHTADQVREFFGVSAAIVHPPVRTGFFTLDPAVKRDGSWLIVSALEPYKRVGLAIEAAARAGAKLTIAGTGSIAHELRAQAGTNVKFEGRVSDDRLRELYRSASVLLFPQVEDFGIVAVEAQACGLPVAAFARGGALETVIDGESGALFREESSAALADAAHRAAGCAESRCVTSAERFSEAAFDAAMQREIEDVLRARPGEYRR